ncbi:metallo-beta-lactamase family protein [Campylobacter jejuni HB-CJGB-LXC]|nr:metallo-beta-lactamase family protein [Campylobacter jejuni subsp. jejuni ICDCCJ07001]ALF92695.1 mRNA degradation ribonuclease J1/J2 (metallo-beta-lactamase superfamily) [Campylobacter jejuni subsp. jejuni]AOW98018.1 mRNA degradation ribonuclease J1/J2 (metallo-beta-lactamase superfamily) [Campylobacter jejuni subsp. jejuni str. RM3420]ASI88196.1 RNA-metabolising Zn-dependent hydrolase [Campylobacter jejuni]EAQ57931.1 metallo-beta-lactamase family protein [Campylobacter jejuni subsp. jejuni 
MDENKEINKNEQNPNSNSKNNKRYKYKNRRKKLADSLQNENDTPKIDQNSNKEISENSENKTEKKKKKNRNLPSKLTGNEDWQIALAECIEANRVSHENRLHPLKYNNSSEHKIRITPLGGLGEIGGNISVFETNKDAIIVDIGMSFPDGTMHGVDIIIPDFDYVRKIKDKIRGIVITHAHEDHIGAVPYFFKEFQFPIYATPLALGMISNKFEEHGLKAERKWFRPVEKRKVYEIGEFDIEWIHITHSIIDASALAIKTKAGTIIHTGDFKIDQTPIDGYPTDLGRLAYYGEEGVLCLLSDSTNSYKEGYTKSESSVGPTFDQIFARTKGRVIMSTFSSNIHRVYQAITYGLKYGRKVCVIGRSMERNLYTTMELGYIKLDRKIFIDADEVSKYKDNEVLIVTTGSQGETMSALYRMATDEHKFIKIKPTDQVIISAKAIPGNEASVSAVLDYLLKAGAKVAYQEFSEIHVSGHASIEEQKLMLTLTKPKFFLPVHGEYNHITKHKETAMKCGIPERNIYLMSDGDQVELCQKYVKRVKTVKTGKVFVDNQINKQIADDVVIDRQKLADSGIVVIIAQIDKTTKTLINKPRVFSYGLVADKHDHAFSKDMAEVLGQFFINVKDEVLNDPRFLENQIRQVLRKHIFRKIKKYPTIVPTIFVM